MYGLDSRWILRLVLYLIGLIGLGQYLAFHPISQSLDLLGLIARGSSQVFQAVVNAGGKRDADSISLFRWLSV